MTKQPTNKAHASAATFEKHTAMLGQSGRVCNTRTLMAGFAYEKHSKVYGVKANGVGL